MGVYMADFTAVSLKFVFGNSNILRKKSGKFYFLGNKESWRFRV